VTGPTVCISENLTTDPTTGLLQLNKWAVPKLVADVMAPSGADGALTVTTALPGKLLINKQIAWTNDAPIPRTLLIRVTRGVRFWQTSNPNAIQFRDRWSYAVNEQPPMPVTTSVFNSQAGGAVDLGTDAVAQPLPGVQYIWLGVGSSDEWVANQIEPNDTFNLWFQTYVWTPPPWSDNANQADPLHSASANYARIQLIAHPTQGALVSG
jgi:hypothetical protein